jgi:predicted HicB family RNase H-like nuclease
MRHTKKLVSAVNLRIDPALARRLAAAAAARNRTVANLVKTVMLTWLDEQAERAAD